MPLPFDTKTTKGQIVYALLQDQPLKPKEIQRIIRKQFGKTITYQAVHKSTLQLEKEKVIANSDSGFRISSVWIEKVSSFSKDLGELVKSPHVSDSKTGSRLNEKILTFDSINDLGKYLIFDFIQHDTSPHHFCIAHWSNMYFLGGSSKEEIETTRQNALKNRWIILCKNKNPVGVMLSNAFKKMGFRVIFTPDIASEDFDLWVVGDYVAQIYYPKKALRLWKKAYSIKKVEDFDFEGELKSVHQITDPIRVHIFRDFELSKKYIKEAAKIAKIKIKESDWVK